MAKIARRSVASNPSSLTASTITKSNLIPNTSGNSYHKTSPSSSSTTNSTATLPSTIDPLRSTGYQFTTRTNSNKTNNSRHGNPPTVQSVSSNSSNNSKNFDNVNTNSTNSTIKEDFNNTAAAAELERLAAQRERIRLEFYATYDVMTGVRIAATLGGFFGLMVFLIVYKSRGNSNETLKVLKDPKMAAVAAACMQEEEEREIQQAMEATGLSIYPDEYDNMLYRRQRMLSVGNVSAPPILHRGFRFSSVGGGGYSSLLEPPRRYSYSGSRRKSASESSRILSAYPMGSSFGTDDYFVETDDELENEFDHLSTRDGTGQKHGFLEVPPTGQESRRSSAMTCCSTESSYLERRCSALTLGLTSLPSTFEEVSSTKRRSSTDIWDYYYPDIQVIQPTPRTSPCPSERSIHDKLKQQSFTKAPSSTTATAAAPATIVTTGDSSSLYSHDRRIIRNGIYHEPDSGGVNKYTESNGHQNSYGGKKYGNTNELKLIVKRKISDPSSINNNSSYNNVYNSSNNNSLQHNNDVRRAPLASISSFKISSIDYQDSDLKSLGSDSVFVESYADTDDDMEQFSTDSDELSIGDPEEPIPISPKPPPPVQPPKLQQVKPVKPVEQHISSKSEPCHQKVDDIRRFNIKRNRPLLERHRTMSVSSNDRIMLISQQSQDQSPNEPEIIRPLSFSGYVSTPPSISRHFKTADTTSLSLPTDELTVTTTTSSTQNTEIQKKPTASFSYDNNNDSCSSSSSSKRHSKDDIHVKSKLSNSSVNSNNECVEVNVIIDNRPTTNIISPSVILELPVITLPSQDDDDEDPPRDPSLPGTSRKWSKETLF